MKKLLLIVLTACIANNALANEEVPKRALQKTKEILTSEPARVVYGILVGAGAGTVITFLVQQMVHQKNLRQKLQEQHDELWRPGEKIAQAIQNNNIDDVINSFDDIEGANVIYGYDDKEDREEDHAGFLLKTNFLKQIRNDIQKEQNEATHPTIKVEETKAFAKVKPYSDAFKDLYCDICGYNVYLVANNMNPWDIELIEDNGFVRGIYVNPPSE